MSLQCQSWNLDDKDCASYRSCQSCKACEENASIVLVQLIGTHQNVMLLLVAAGDDVSKQHSQCFVACLHKR